MVSRETCEIVPVTGHWSPVTGPRSPVTGPRSPIQRSGDDGRGPAPRLLPCLGTADFAVGTIGCWVRAMPAPTDRRSRLTASLQQRRLPQFAAKNRQCSCAGYIEAREDGRSAAPSTDYLGPSSPGRPEPSVLDENIARGLAAATPGHTQALVWTSGQPQCRREEEATLL